jgi:hypothetical protein
VQSDSGIAMALTRTDDWIRSSARLEMIEDLIMNCAPIFSPTRIKTWGVGILKLE